MTNKEEKIDIDNVLRIMKHNHGWGDAIMNRIEDFENSSYYKNPETDNEYVGMFHSYLMDIAHGVIDEVDVKNVKVSTYKADDENDLKTFSKDIKKVPDNKTDNITYNDEENTFSIKSESKIMKSRDFISMVQDRSKINLSESDIIRILEETQNPVMKKSDFVSLIKNNLIFEANMNDDVRRRFESGENDYSDLLGSELANRLAQESFREIADNIRRKTGKQDVSFGDVQQLLGNSLLAAAREEYRIGIENLERKAVDMIRKQYNIPIDAVEFDAKIVGLPPEMLVGRDMTPTEKEAASRQLGIHIGKINREGLKMSRGNRELPQDKTEDEMKPLIKRRRLTNAMMHGAARKSQNLHHLDDQLREENPELGRNYANLMAANDANYFLIDDETIKREGESGIHAGNVRLDLTNPDKPKIIAQGMVFPILLHELSKGVVELMSLWGLPKDSEVRKYVLDKTDNLESETNDIRLGTKIWEKFVEQIPAENQEVISLTWNMLQELPDNDFNSIIEGLLQNSTDAQQKVRRMAEDALDELRSEESDDTFGLYGDEDEEDGDTLTPPEEEETDDVLSNLMRGQETEEDGEIDYENMSRSELETEIDRALDAGDMELVRYLGSILNKK